MTWKQPIPVKIEGLTKKEESVMIHLIRRCRNESSVVEVGGETIELKRGQCYLGRYEFAEEFLLKKNETLRVYKILQRLAKSNKLINISRHRNCSVITVLKYDEYTEMNISENIWRTSGEHLENTNKSVKSVKSVERERAHPNNFSERKSITDKVISEIAINYKVSDEFVKDCWDSAINWCNAKGKIQKDYKAFLSNWVKREKASMILKNKNTHSMLRREPKDIKFDRFGNPIGGTK